MPWPRTVAQLYSCTVLQLKKKYKQYNRNTFASISPAPSTSAPQEKHHLVHCLFPMKIVSHLSVYLIKCYKLRRNHNQELRLK